MTIMKKRNSIYDLLLMACLAIFQVAPLYAQNRPISGTVRDATEGTPLTGVSVRVAGKSQVTATDQAGLFSIQAAQGDALVFSYLGYTTEEVTVGTATTYTVDLQRAAAEQLGEVVVTALGIQRQTRSLAYSTQQLSNDDLNAVKSPGANIMNNIAGKVAGAVITPAATGPGSAARVVLRGNRSISGNNNALIVVDGVPIDNTMTTEQGGGGSANTVATQQKSISSGYSGSDGAASINPEDVESINVLKGPAATALYGSRAANGAVIITTKSGKAGKMSIGYNGGISIDNPLLLMDFQNTYGRGNNGTSTADAGQSWGAQTQTYPNNVRDFYETGTSINNSVNIMGGNEKLQGYASFSNNAINGIVPENRLDRNTVNLRVNAEIIPKLTTDVKVTYVHQKIGNKPRLGDNGVTNEAMIMPRDLSPEELADFETFDETGKPIPKYWTNSTAFQNPYWDVYRTRLDEERNRVILMGSVKYELTDWLSVLGRYSLDRYDDKIAGAFHEGTLPLPTNPGGRYQETFVNRWERNMDILLTGNNPLGETIQINYNIGASVLRNKGYNSQALANGLSIPNQFNLNFASAPAVSSLVVQKEIQSVYANAQFGFKNLLFLEASARNDWSSTLPAPYSFFYPSVGISAILSDMLQLPEWVSLGKARVAYTQVGNDADPYLLLQTYTYAPGAGNGFVSRDQTKYINDLKPERTEAWEAGLEWRFFNNRLGLDATIYKTNTKNQLIFIGLPQPSGYNQQYINAGNIENKGIELMINGTPMEGEHFSWNTSVNFALNRNKVISLSPEVTSVSLSSAYVFGSLLLKKGERYGDIYDYQWAKDKSTGQYLINANGLPVVETLQKIGNFNPDYTLGWNNQFSYNRFNLSFLVDGRVGGIVISGTDAALASFGIAEYTTKYRDGGLILPGILPDGSPNNIAISAEQLWTQVSQAGRSGYGGFFAYSATNFRLRELSLGYTFDINQAYVKAARVSLTGRNLFFLYRGKSLLDIPGIGKRTIPVDPENAIGTSNYQGIESGVLPSSRSFGLNLSLTF